MILRQAIGAAAGGLIGAETPGARAVRVFRQPPHRLNCAQAVAHAWGSGDAAAQTEIARLGAHGGGNAPEGIRVNLSPHLLRQQ